LTGGIRVFTALAGYYSACSLALDSPSRLCNILKFTKPPQRFKKDHPCPTVDLEQTEYTWHNRYRRNLETRMQRSNFAVPVEERYLEDYEPGSVHEFGEIRVEEDEIIEFGRRFDPQVFHTSPQEAANTVYGGLIASGWHTAGLMMRLFVEHYLSGVASLGSPGVDELRWLKPVRPGDMLRLRVTVVETKRSRSKPDRGVLFSFIEVLNQKHEVVMQMRAVNLLMCRRKP
jgi:acyl dehydratase